MTYGKITDAEGLELWDLIFLTEIVAQFLSCRDNPSFVCVFLSLATLSIATHHLCCVD